MSAGDDTWNAIKELLFDDDAKAFVELAKGAGVPAPNEDDVGYEVEGDDGEVVATVEEKLEKLGWRILSLLDAADIDTASYFGGDN